MQGRKPIRAEWKIFEHYKLDSRDWLVQKSTNSFLQIVHKQTGEEKKLNMTED